MRWRLTARARGAVGRGRGGWALLLALLLALPLLPGPAAAATVPMVPPVEAGLAIPGEVLVGLTEAAGPVSSPTELPAELQPLLGRFAIVEATAAPSLPLYRLRSASGADPATMAAAFAAHPLVRLAEPNTIARVAATPNDPLYAGGNQWHLRAVNIEEAWAITTGSAAIRVAVVDTGIDGRQVDLVGTVVGGFDFANERFVLGDDIGHGTAVASFVTARTDDERGLAGLAPGVRLLDYKAFLRTPDGGSAGTYFDVTRGIIAAADAGARVINLSLGSSAPSRIIREAVAYAVGKGAVVVAAAGNDGTGAPHYPAAEPLVLAVGATGRDDTVVGFSQWGPHLSVVAPGAGVLGAVAGGDQEVINGTSFSAPIVSGVAALMLSVNPGLTPAEIQRMLEGTADDIGAPGWDPYAGWGRVNAGRAVAAARDGQTAPNRSAVIEGRVSGGEAQRALISVEPLGEVVRPAADGSYRLPYRGRTSYALRATLAGGRAIGPVTVESSGQPGDVRRVDFDFGP